MNNAPFKIRFMRKDDLSQVAEIDKEAFPTQWPPTNYRSELMNNLARYLVVYKEADSIAWCAGPPSRNVGFFARIKKFFSGKNTAAAPRPVDIVAGFVGGWIMADELHITEIATRAAYRGQGVGHLMLISIIEIGYELRARVATLEVRRSNISAQKIYEEFGFEKVGFRKAYYSDNKEDAIIMTTPNFTTPEFQSRLTRLKSEFVAKSGISSVPAVERPEAARR